MSPIDIIAAALRAQGVTISDVLVPEQCLLMYTKDGKLVNVIAEELDPKTMEAKDPLGG